MYKDLLISFISSQRFASLTRHHQHLMPSKMSMHFVHQPFSSSSAALQRLGAAAAAATLHITTSATSSCCLVHCRHRRNCYLADPISFHSFAELHITVAAINPLRFHLLTPPLLFSSSAAQYFTSKFRII